MTLIELLVVIAVIGILLSIGVGAWVTFRAGANRKRAFSSFMNICRQARVFALEAGVESRVIITRPANPKDSHSFRAEGLRLLGFWHFEVPLDSGPESAKADQFTGFAERQLGSEGGQAVTNGFHGGAIYFHKGGSVSIPAECGRLPQGGQISFCLYPERVERQQVLLERGKDFKLTLTAEKHLIARVGTTELSTEPYKLPCGQWSRVALGFDSQKIDILVNNVSRAHTPSDQEIELPGAKDFHLPIVFGVGEWSYYGGLDELAVHAKVRGNEHVFSENIWFEPGVEEIHFDKSGMLDRRFHSGPARIGIRSLKPDGGENTRWITIRITGEIRED